MEHIIIKLLYAFYLCCERKWELQSVTVQRSIWVPVGFKGKRKSLQVKLKGKVTCTGSCLFTMEDEDFNYRKRPFLCLKSLSLQCSLLLPPSHLPSLPPFSLVCVMYLAISAVKMWVVSNSQTKVRSQPPHFTCHDNGELKWFLLCTCCLSSSI